MNPCPIALDFIGREVKNLEPNSLKYIRIELLNNKFLSATVEEKEKNVDIKLTRASILRESEYGMIIITEGKNALSESKDRLIQEILNRAYLMEEVQSIHVSLAKSDKEEYLSSFYLRGTEIKDWKY